jgi:hypothetical protein
MFFSTKEVKIWQIIEACNCYPLVYQSEEHTSSWCTGLHVIDVILLLLIMNSHVIM